MLSLDGGVTGFSSDGSDERRLPRIFYVCVRGVWASDINYYLSTK